MEKIKGLIDAPFTPFHPNGDVNLEPIEAYADMLQKNGLKGVFINGSSGEGYMLTTEERMALAERWVSVAPDGFKVIVHVGSCCLRESVRLAAHAQQIGAWGIGSMAPPFPKIGRIEELVKYCEQIAEAAPALPFYYYHIPAFNGAFLPMLDLLKAVDGRIPNFAGIKYELVGIIDAWQRGDIDTAREKQNFSQAVINVICHYRGNIVGGKRIMKLIGFDLGPNRVPFQNMTEEEETAMRRELEDIGFFERCNKF